MIPALDSIQMLNKARELYAGEQRVIGIMLARYTMNLVKNIVDSEYIYCHYNSGREFSILWAGYGDYVYTNFKPTQIPLDCPVNKTGVYFDLNAFIKCKDSLKDLKGFHYNDEPALVLLQFDRTHFDFNKYVRIDLEKNKDDSNRFIRNIMEIIINECKSKHCLEDISRSIKKWKLFRDIKGIEASDAISTILGIAGIITTLA
jgi:hypothetical protein